MQLVLEIKHLQDLNFLIPLLKRLKIKIIKQPEQVKANNQKMPALSKHIGTLPNLNTEAFEQYLQQSRSEWERPIY